MTSDIIILHILFVCANASQHSTALSSFYQSLAEILDVVILHRNDYQNHSQDISNLKILLDDQISHIFCSSQRRGIIIHTSNLTELEFFKFMENVCSSSNCQPKSFNKQEHWTPYVFFIWPNLNVLDFKEFEKRIIAGYSEMCLAKGNEFRINSDVYILVPSRGNSLVLYELYSIKNLTVLRQLQENRYQIFRFETLQKKAVRRHDFMGVKVRAAAVEWVSPFKGVIFKEINGELAFESGYNGDYFNTMAKALNISVVGVKANSSIVLNADGTLGGAGKQLIDGDVDISTLHSEYASYRAQHLTLLWPHYTYKLRAFFVQPAARHLTLLWPHYTYKLRAFFVQPAAHSVRNIYIGSIGNELQIAILCTGMFILICLVAIIYIRCKYIESSEQSIATVLQWGISALCQQGSHIQHICSSLRIGLITTLGFSVMIYNIFSASVVSQLSVPVTPIKSFNDIIQHGMGIYTDPLTPSALEFIAHAEMVGTIKPMSTEERLISDAQALFNKILTSPSVCLELRDDFYLSIFSWNYSVEFVCDTISDVDVDPIGLPVLSGMTVRKDSPYTEYFKYVQLEMREYGIHQRLHDNMLRHSVPKCEHVGHKEIPKLGLNDTFTAFSFLLVLMVISATILLVEIATKSPGLIR